MPLTALAFWALAFVLGVQGTLTVSAREPQVTVATSRGFTVTSIINGYAECRTTDTDGSKVGYVTTLVHKPGDEVSLEHELLHAVDCVDNGVMDGSPLPFPPTWKDAGHEWVYWAQDHPDQARTIIQTLR